MQARATFECNANASHRPNSAARCTTRAAVLAQRTRCLCSTSTEHLAYNMTQLHRGMWRAAATRARAQICCARVSVRPRCASRRRRNTHSVKQRAISDAACELQCRSCGSDCQSDCARNRQNCETWPRARQAAAPQHLTSDASDDSSVSGKRCGVLSRVEARLISAPSVRDERGLEAVELPPPAATLPHGTNEPNTH